MRVLITGSQGFIGKNLSARFAEENIEYLEYTRNNKIDDLSDLLSKVDVVIHLAAENRPVEVSDYVLTNVGLTQAVCDAVRLIQKKPLIILASSTQALLDNPYGESKRLAEDIVRQLSSDTGCSIIIYRLPGIFGKWARPNYNSVVATFCHNIANDLPIQIENPEITIRLVYIDDVINDFMSVLNNWLFGISERKVSPEYLISLGQLADQVQAFRNCRTSLLSEPVGCGFVRALYSTYMSYLPPSKFAYDIPSYTDQRGTFVEMLKTQGYGQMSCFTCNPGVTRGGHYHHSKTEKFLVVKGKGRFRFRHIVSGNIYEIITTGDMPRVVESIPGWAHDITNIGNEEMVVMLWANELFDRSNPDTIACKV